MAVSQPPTQRQMRWYYPPYNPTPEEARKDVEAYLRWRGIEPPFVAAEDAPSR
jgi:hypothetical protein